MPLLSWWRHYGEDAVLKMQVVLLWVKCRFPVALRPLAGHGAPENLPSPGEGVGKTFLGGVEAVRGLFGGTRLFWPEASGRGGFRRSAPFPYGAALALSPVSPSSRARSSGVRASITRRNTTSTA